jgi:dTDP-4-amino-4,6-dideoxygalactose transaminase
MSDKVNYNPWPLGPIPEHLQRPEIGLLRKSGYEFKDAREAVTIFENKVAQFTGAPYAISVDCCSHGIFLAFQWHKKVMGNFNYSKVVTIPAHTYASIPMQVRHAGFVPVLEEREWSGIYQLMPFPIWDAAVRWQKGMYHAGGFQVLSFQYKKRIPIGKGGMILTDNKEAADWFRLATYDGRDLATSYDDPNHIRFSGYHYYMTPEDAARGILLMDQIFEEGDSSDWTKYPDLRKFKF